MAHWKQALAVSACVVVLGGATACGGDDDTPEANKPRGSTTTTSTTTPASTTPPMAAPTENDLSVQAVSDDAVREGIAAGTFTVADVIISTVDPSWAEAGVGPNDPRSLAFQAYRALAHKENGTWSVVSSGTAEVGCGAAPADVLAAFGQDCNTLGVQWHPGSGCQPYQAPVIAGDWQTVAPREPKHSGTAGSSMVELGLRLKEGTQGDNLPVVAVLSMPDSSNYSSKVVNLPPGNEFVELVFPEDFPEAARTGTGLSGPGDYTVLWSASTQGTLACDGFSVD